MQSSGELRKCVILPICGARRHARCGQSGRRGSSISANALAKGVVVQPLTLAKVNDLDFGTVVGSSASGTVTIDPDTGLRTVTGGVTGVPSFPGGRGLFQGNGTGGNTVQLTLSGPAVLISQSNPTDTVTASNWLLDSGNALNADYSGWRDVQRRRGRDIRYRREPACSALPGDFHAHR